MLRRLPRRWAARAIALLPAACIALAAAAPRAGMPATGREFADAAGTAAGLPYVRWVTESGGERRIDVYAFDCARGRYAHVVSERHRGATRIERIALPEERWPAALQALPPKYPVLSVHRARSIACAPPERRR